MKDGLRNCKEVRCEQSFVSFIRQKSIILQLYNFLNSSEGTGDSSNCKGWGSPYCMQRSLTIRNHDLDEGRDLVKVSTAMECRGLP